MTLKNFAFALAAAAFTLGLAQPAAAALIIHTETFISEPINFAGFEDIGGTSSYTGGYKEGGIYVEQNDPGAEIWTYSQSGEGKLSWYPNGGNKGYTEIRLTEGGLIGAIEFLVGSGFGDSEVALEFELLFKGESVASGEAGPVPSYGKGFITYGFSGIDFDTVRLQAQNPGSGKFDPGAFQALALDAIRIGPGDPVTPDGPAAAVPEPATWALMLAGFGLMGFALRRKKQPVRVRFAF
jgi:hypothetical protein